ncbi:hypothetical protein [Anaerorhabdus furcosa]|uniref:Na+/glutamate symporter n=1 Tax=Anaerorhabdus furcosa TaxID=118967 RepID=A0A1T4KHG6_9FIRM|nr:hypothetical protein [Anaerorhabdus furcosa]SJZ41844.1 hypothetical protein SAMN02745191_0540 [Anaerorhabdus furcosa]
MWDISTGFAVIAIIMLVGEIISSKTGGKLPQMFIVATLFLFGYWTFLPKDILTISGLSVVAEICKIFILIHVGSMFNVKSLIKDWRVVVTTLCAIVGILALVLTIGTVIFGKDMAIIAAAPLTGGGMAAMIMNEGAIAIGKSALGVVAFVIFIMQGFVGFPVTAFFLRKEGERLVEEIRNNPNLIKESSTKSEGEQATSKKKIYEYVPTKICTPTYYLTVMGVLGCLGLIIFKLLNGAIDRSIVMIIVGVAASQFGLIPPNPMNKSDSAGILNLALFASFMSGFADTTPASIGQMVIVVFGLLIIATVGILLFSIPVGKKFGYSTWMASAIGLNCFLGFPYNYNLTNEAVDVVAKTEEEKTYLTEQMLPKMIIGSVVAVTLVSCIVAGVLVKML